MEVESAAIEETVPISHTTNGDVNLEAGKGIATVNGDSIGNDQGGDESLPDNGAGRIDADPADASSLGSDNGSGPVCASHEGNGSGWISADVAPIGAPDASPSPPPPPRSPSPSPSPAPSPPPAAEEQPWPTSGWEPEGNGSGWISADGAPVVLSVAAAAEQPWPTLKRHTYYLIRVPRSVDEKLREEIRSAEAKLDQIIKKQDANRVAMQGKKSQKGELLDKLKRLRERERGFVAALQEKRTKMEPFSMALNKFKGAQINLRGKGQDVCSSEEELNERIGELEYRIQHESISLNEEKQLLREIKNLESTRRQVCANSILQQELVESLGPREEIQDQHKFICQDMDSVRKDLNSAVAEREPVEKELDKLNKEMEELRPVYDNLNAARQEAFLALRELKRQENSKNDGFFENKRDIQTAKELATQRKREELESFCSNHTEIFMKMWNNDGNFRDAYTKSNERSTVRRLETLDGRSLGPGEKPPQTNETGYSSPTVSDSKQATESSAATAQMKVSKTAPSVSKVDHAVVKNEEQLKPPSSIIKEEKIEKSSESVSSHKPIIEQDDSGEGAHDFEAHALELKERHRQEQIAKAKEAEERKKKRADKSEMKALVRAKKEAERKEKEREKKALKRAAAASTVGTTDAAVASQGEELGLVTEKAASSDVENSSGKGAAGTDNTANGGRMKSNAVSRRKSAREAKGPRPPLPSRLGKKSAFPFPLWASVAVVGMLLLLVAFLFLR